LHAITLLATISRDIHRFFPGRIGTISKAYRISNIEAHTPHTRMNGQLSTLVAGKLATGPGRSFPSEGKDAVFIIITRPD
jgi:hypothetical protein